jgi:tRNA-splicing ligase RtcB
LRALYRIKRVIKNHTNTETWRFLSIYIKKDTLTNKFKPLSTNLFMEKYKYEIQKENGMNVPAIVFSDEKLFEKIKQDKTLQQIKNVAMLPGIIKNALAMPDAHQGYGFPIGGVAAFDLDKGVISPGGVGYDINCSVRILKTNLTEKDIKRKEKLLTKELFKATPNGVGSKSKLILKEKELDEVLQKGLNWCLEKGFATKEDLEFTEDEGCLPNANPKDVSRKARGRGIPQLGTLGAGNHFVELQIIDKIINKKIAKEWGLEEGQVTIMIHCGSRGLGHQVASDYIQLMEKEYGWPKQDRELVNAPIKSELGQKYLSAMACAANFGFANKQLITNSIREAFKKIFPEFKAEVIYDVCHNIAKIEEHKIEEKNQEVLIMRKGATRSFGPGRKELPKEYQKTGQPVLIPGSMGTASYILVGTKEAEELSFSSTAHGAGRVSSRSFANKNISAKEVKETLNKKGIEIEAGSEKGLVEEAPEVYKDIDEVVSISDKAGLAKIVAKLRPVGVVKG